MKAKDGVIYSAAANALLNYVKDVIDKSQRATTTIEKGTWLYHGQTHDETPSKGTFWSQTRGRAESHGDVITSAVVKQDICLGISTSQIAYALGYQILKYKNKSSVIGTLQDNDFEHAAGKMMTIFDGAGDQFYGSYLYRHLAKGGYFDCYHEIDGLAERPESTPGGPPVKWIRDDGDNKPYGEKPYFDDSIFLFNIEKLDLHSRL